MLKKSRVKNQVKTNKTPTLFQTLSSIGNEKNTTIIFPVPIDILGHFMKGQKVTKGESRGSRKSRSRPSGLDLHTPTARPGTDQTLLQGDSPRCTYLHRKLVLIKLQFIDWWLHFWLHLFKWVVCKMLPIKHTKNYVTYKLWQYVSKKGLKWPGFEGFFSYWSLKYYPLH